MIAEKHKGALSFEVAPQVRYTLRSPEGQWLHMSLDRHDDGSPRLTEVIGWRWTGNLSQLKKVRRDYPGFEIIRLMRSLPRNPKI